MRKRDKSINLHVWDFCYARDLIQAKMVITLELKVCENYKSQCIVCKNRVSNISRL